MVQESIIDFFKTGELKSLPKGMLMDDFIATCDSSPWVVPLSSTDLRPSLIKYGQTEFYFDDANPQHLKSIQVTFTMAAKEMNLSMDYGIFIKGVDKIDLTDFLKAEQISWNEVEGRIVTETGVTVYFDKYDGISKFNNF